MMFHLQIITPNGQYFDGQAEKVIVPAIHGPVGILARHINYVTALGEGQVKVVTDQGERLGVCRGGLVAVMDGKVRILTGSFSLTDKP